MTEDLIIRKSGRVGHISLNRPEKLNAINAVMVGELNTALDRAESDPNVKVIILRGEGKCFSAGFDLDTGEEEEAAISRALQNDFNVIMRFWESPKPTIAAVHTYCLGSAMEMAVACDITLAAEGCRFGAPEVRFGSGIVALVLPWLIGPKRTKELLLTGDDRVTAQQAESWGLVNHVVPEGELLERAEKIATNIAGNDELAVRLTKKAINRTYEIAGMQRALEKALELDIQVETSESDDSREFNRILKSEGARAAVQWRNSRQ